MTKKKEKSDRGLYDSVQTLVCAVTVMVLLSVFVVRLTSVSGPSMRETLQDGDKLIVLNGWLCGNYHPGDIVIAAKDTFEGGEPIVKRVIAVEGQTVDIDFDEGVVYVDGTALEESYTKEPTWLEEGTVFPLTVPEGCAFLMGDNRNDSKDSRHPDLGAVDTRCIIGRALFLAAPGKTAALDQREWSRIGPLK